MSILDLVLQQLQEEDFDAQAAYPGQMYPLITKPMAAVHIQNVDRASLTATVEVSIITPAATGGAACEEMALRATEVLRRGGAKCEQNGCRYDGVSRAYIVPILATYSCLTDVDACVIGLGFKVYINGIIQKNAVRFCAAEEYAYEAAYTMGESAPADIRRDGCLWHIELEDLTPTATTVGMETAGTFELKVYTLDRVETFSGCCWTCVKREHSREGLRRIFQGVALRREVT